MEHKLTNVQLKILRTYSNVQNLKFLPLSLSHTVSLFSSDGLGWSRPMSAEPLTAGER